MFCPSCGSEERQANQFCRACGTDLRAVRVGLERPDSITASAESAREEIGRAVAEKIREMNDPQTIERFTHAVLPKVEKFLESPEEKRQRRLRSGTIATMIGLILAVPAVVILVNINDIDGKIYLGGLAGLAMIILATGLGLLINGLLFSKSRAGVKDKSEEARLQSLLDAGYSPPAVTVSAPAALRAQTTSNLVEPRSSVTEHTTLHLGSER